MVMNVPSKMGGGMFVFTSVSILERKTIMQYALNQNLVP